MGNYFSCPRCEHELELPNPGACSSCGLALPSDEPAAEPASAARADANESLRQRFERMAKEARAREPYDAGIRVYVLHRANEDGFVARQGSLSFCEGEPLDARQAPEHQGEPMRHLFTLDFNDAPELRAIFARADGLSLFAPGDEHFIDFNATHGPVPLVTKGLTSTAPTGSPVAVMPLHVPTSLFEHSLTAETPAIMKLRALFRGSSGYVLGGPLWIEEPEPRRGQFLAQVTVGLGRTPLPTKERPDGCLYVYSKRCRYQR